MVFMDIVVLGSSGFIGKKLVKRLREQYTVYGLSRSPSEFTDFQVDASSEDTITLLRRLNPDIIINSIKLPQSIDYYETHEAEAEIAEIESMTNTSEWAEENKKKIIMISTDYVYDGITGDYNEESETNPLNLYGKLKLKAEGIAKNVENHAILRTTGVFDYIPNDKNFLMQIIDAKEERKIPYDQISNPTSINVLGYYIEKVIKEDMRGLYIAAGSYPIDRFSLALTIAGVFDLNVNLFKRVKTSELGQIAKRPLNNSLDNSKITNLLHYNCPTVLESLRLIKRRMHEEPRRY